MFHSAGYFRGVLCPFFEHGLCHRPHCHYKHSKPGSTKQPVKPILNIHPKLHSNLTPAVNKPEVKLDQPVKELRSSDKKIEDIALRGGEAAGTLQEKGTSEESTMKPVPDVDAVGHVSNYFGSTASGHSDRVPGHSDGISGHLVEKPEQLSGATGRSDDGKCDEEVSGDGGSEEKVPNVSVEGNTAIGHLSKETIGRLAGQIAEQLSGNSCDQVAETDRTELPSYAPEKCMSGFVGERDGKGSSLEHGTAGLEETEARGSGHVTKLEGMLVSEKDIFGCDDDYDDDDGEEDNACTDSKVEKEKQPPSDPSEHVSMADDLFDPGEGGGNEEANDLCAVDDEEAVGDGKSSSHGLSEAEMMTEFNKLTSLSADSTIDTNTKKRKKPTEDEEMQIPVKKRRVAHPQAKNVGARGIVRVEPRNMTVDSNFSSVVAQADLNKYTGKKRIANQASSSMNVVVKRPRLPLNPNAKIATVVREKYLNAFIDEHLKMILSPQEAYKKALEEERQLFEASHSSRSSYLNKSYQALKKLRSEVEQYLTQQKSASDSRVQSSKELSAEDLLRGKRTEAGDATKTLKKSVKSLSATSRDTEGGGWKALDAELQSVFSQSSASKKRHDNPGKSIIKVPESIKSSATIKQSNVHVPVTLSHEKVVSHKPFESALVSMQSGDNTTSNFYSKPEERGRATVKIKVRRMEEGSKGKMQASKDKVEGSKGRVEAIKGKISMEGSRGKIQASKDRVEGSKGGVEATKGKMEGRGEASKGKMEGSKGRVEASKGKMEGSKDRVEAIKGGSKGKMEGSKGKVDARKGKMEGSKGKMESGKDWVEASKAKGKVEASRGKMESSIYRMQDSRMEGSTRKVEAKKHKGKVETDKSKGEMEEDKRMAIKDSKSKERRDVSRKMEQRAGMLTVENSRGKMVSDQVKAGSIKHKVVVGKRKVRSTVDEAPQEQKNESTWSYRQKLLLSTSKLKSRRDGKRSHRYQYTHVGKDSDRDRDIDADSNEIAMETDVQLFGRGLLDDIGSLGDIEPGAIGSPEDMTLLGGIGSLEDVESLGDRVTHQLSTRSISHTEPGVSLYPSKSHRQHQSRKRSSTSTDPLLTGPSLDPLLVDLTSELFGSDSEESVALLSCPSSPTPTLPLSTSPFSMDTKHSISCDHRPHPPTFIVLSSDEDDDSDIGPAVSFENALASIDNRPKQKIKKLQKANERGMPAPLKPSHDQTPSKQRKSGMRRDRAAGETTPPLPRQKESKDRLRSSSSSEDSVPSLFSKVPSLKLVKANIANIRSYTKKLNTPRTNARVSGSTGIPHTSIRRPGNLSPGTPCTPGSTSTPSSTSDDSDDSLQESMETPVEYVSHDLGDVSRSLDRMSRDLVHSSHEHLAKPKDITTSHKSQRSSGYTSLSEICSQPKAGVGSGARHSSSVEAPSTSQPKAGVGSGARHTSSSGSVEVSSQLKGSSSRHISSSGSVEAPSQGSSSGRFSSSGSVEAPYQLKAGVGSSARHTSSVEVPSEPKAGVGSSAKRRSSSSSSAEVPSHQPCGPYIKLSRMPLPLKQPSKVSLSSSHLRKLPGHTPTPYVPNPLSSDPVKARKDPVKARKDPGKEAQLQRTSTTSNFTILKKKKAPPLTSELFYTHMCPYLLTEQQLVDNHYPCSTPKRGVACINREGAVVAKVKVVGPNAVQHECCRCHKPFIIYNDGQYQTVESCSYHYGKAFKYREYGEGVVSKYSCCQERSGSPGCQLARLHVTAGEKLEHEAGYVCTMPSPRHGERDSAPSHRGCVVYALDCEMCYTTVGLQLTRVSVVDMHLEPVYETLVKPSHTIVDYNTRFSGLTAGDFVGVETTLSQVQEQLLDLFSSETILVGHSLESDLQTLKIIHSQVVDTAIVFPHKLGPPYKKALKTLAKDVLHKFIQNDVDDGHDSLEDSRACMELMIWKVKGDLKALCRRKTTD